MYAEVVPQLRMLPNLGIFDYEIPKGMKIKPGDLVEIDFRKNKYPGLVLNTKKTTYASKLKAINKKINDYQFTKQQLEFFKWFFKKYNVSPALALKTILPEIPKRVLDAKPLQSKDAKTLNINKNRVEQIKQGIKTTTENKKPTLIHYNQYNEKIAYYSGLIKQYKQVLIIAPELQEVFKLGAYLAQYKPVLIHGQLSKNQEWNTWKQIINDEVKLILGTKTAIFIPPQNLDLIIIDDEEDRSHENFDQNPKYHARTCAEKIAELNKIKLAMTSQAPSIGAHHKYKKTDLLLPTTHHPQLSNMDDERKQKNYSWFSTALLNEIKIKRSFLLFNRKGLAKLLVCESCHEVYVHQEMESCKKCGAHKLKMAAYGTTKLTQELRKTLPNKKIVQLDKDTKASEVTSDFDIVIGTEYALRNLDFDKIDFVGIISVDHQLIIPDPQAAARVFQLITRVINLGKPMILQTNAPENVTLQAALHQNYEQFYKQEIKYAQTESSN